MTTRRTVAIVNAAAGGRSARTRWDELAPIVASHLGPVREIISATKAEAVASTRTALLEGATHVVAAGGDGTVSGVVNGFFDPEAQTALSPEAVLVVAPLGTGNDYARSTGIAGRDLAGVLASSTPRRVDVGRVEMRRSGGERLVRVFANSASFGVSARIAQEVSGSAKRLGGSLAYWVGSARVLLTARAARVRLSFDGAPAYEQSVSMVVAGNGRYVGGGMKIAPDACLDDGLLDVVSVGEVGLAAFLRHSKRLYAGSHVDLPFVSVRRAARVDVEPAGEADPATPADIDGEPEGVLPLRYQVLPGALAVLAPWRDAEAVATADPV